ncbi:hypothetical protein [Lacticaseibacillus mingshuiensis]|uniref:Uncharacterized protein n=1 Tax=Lacticaseibacillus mingshuiensis TaxID=2799574 RepID=A0ABW4CMK7_9LACO|nr:hypothetical protein [Lacticaseibacillus mingshuiensis]
MEIGPLSEWVAGIAELLAVCVALFLPYYNERKKLRRKTRNLRVSLVKWGKQALDGDAYALRVLDMYLMISYMGNMNADFELLVSKGRALTDAIKALPAATDPAYQAQRTAIEAQLAAL